MKDLDSRLLSIFYQIYIEKSVSKAADVLELGQPTVSSHLNMLRKHFNDPLFIRIQNSMVATELAEQLFPLIENVLSQFQQVNNFNIEFSAATSELEFSISMTDISHQVLFPRLLNRIIQVAPNIKLHIKQINANTSYEMANGEVDLAIGFLPQLETGFYQQSLFDQQYVVICKKDHPTLTGHYINKEDYQKQLHISVQPTGGHYLLEHALQSLNIKRKVFLHLPNYLGIGSIVQESNVIATVPSFLAQVLSQKENIKILMTNFHLPSYTVKQHWHARVHQRASHKWLRETCYQYFSDMNALVINK